MKMKTQQKQTMCERDIHVWRGLYHCECGETFWDEKNHMYKHVAEVRRWMEKIEEELGGEKK